MTTIDRDALLDVMAREAYDTAKPTDGQRDMASLMLAAAAKHILAPLRELHAAYPCPCGKPTCMVGCRGCAALHPCKTTRLLDAIEADLIGDPHA